MRAHALIVGGGVMGTAIARELARRCDPIERPVVLLERRELGAGSSGRSGAILRQFYGSRELIGMARDSLRAYAGFAAATGRPIGFTRCGVLTIASKANADSYELLERNAELMRECGVVVERVEAREMRSLVPRIEVGDDSLGAWEPTSGFVDPVRTVAAFAAAARSAGAIVRCGSEVREIVVERGRAVAVETSDETIEAERIVVAAGPWTRRLLARAGVELPLRAVRPEQHFLDMPRPARLAEEPPEVEAAGADLDARFVHEPEPAVAHPVLLDLDHGYYTRCEPRLQRSRVGALDYARDLELEDPDALDERVSDEFQRWARAALERRLPIYRERADAGAQAAWYTLTPDAQAVIGPCAGVANLYVASGFSGHGFKLAPSIGEGVAQMLLGEPIGAFDPRFFAPQRFASSDASAARPFGL